MNRRRILIGNIEKKDECNKREQYTSTIMMRLKKDARGYKVTWKTCYAKHIHKGACNDKKRKRDVRQQGKKEGSTHGYICVCVCVCMYVSVI